MESNPAWIKEYLEPGAATCSMHVSDCHILLLRESPTNMIFFPLYLSMKSRPLNLCQFNIYDVRM